MSFSVLTLNLWNINEPLATRYSALAKGLSVLRPDIVCLQEVDRDPKSARSQTELVAKYCSLAHFAGDEGLSIVSRYPVARSSNVPLPEFPGDSPRQVLLAELLIERRRVLVANTHLAYRPEMVRERREQAEALLAALKRFRSSDRAKTKVLCGDFNDVPSSPAVRKVLDSDEDLYDVFARCCPDSSGFTYSCQNPYVDPSSTEDQRIDYIFASRDLVAKECSVVFDGSKGLNFASDHFGVFSKLAFAGRRASKSQRRALVLSR